VIGGDNKSISDATGIVGLDNWGGPTGWANVSYAFGPASECRDASAATSISVDVTSEEAGPIRISLHTEASDASSNHFRVLETFAAGETKTITLNLDGSNLQSSWAPADAVWDPEHLIALIVIPIGTDDVGLAPYGISMTNIVVN
jgi:hypothetical protein